jgi:hypothetical protein
MSNTKIMLNFVNYIANCYDDDFEIERIIQHTQYKCKYKIVTRCDDYDLIILHTHDNSLCVRWEDDIYSCQDGEWRLVGTFY